MLRALLLFAFSMEMTMVPATVGATDPVDVIVYGDHLPLHAPGPVLGSVSPLLTPFDDFREDADDPQTRIGLQVVPGLRHPTGTMAWGLAAWAKYVIVGNFAEDGGGSSPVEDQRVGVFDSETKTFCELDLDSNVQAQATVEHLAVADPLAPQTRIYFQGFNRGSPANPPSHPTDDEGYWFGYIDADLGNPHPCDPVTGWRVYGAKASLLNQKAVHQDRLPCPSNTSCWFDGIAILNSTHAGGSQTQTVVLNNWAGTRLVIATIGSQGIPTDLSVPDVHVEPVWKSPDDGACYRLPPVASPAVDPTSGTAGAPDRFAVAFDRFCERLNPEPGTAGCLAAGAFCPGPSRLPCDPGLNDPVDPRFGPCTGINDRGACLGFICNTHCAGQHPNMRCAAAPNLLCLNNNHCPASGTCACHGNGKPAREYRFDASTSSVSPTGPTFQAEANVAMLTMERYDSMGNLWLGAYSPTPGSPLQGNPVIYRKLPGGGHVYDSATSGYATPDQVMPFEGSFLFDAFHLAQQVGSSMYMVGQYKLQRANFAYGTWIKDTPYEVSLGTRFLPAETRVCSVRGGACNPFAPNCTGGQVCLPAPGGGSSCASYCDDAHACPVGQSCLSSETSEYFAHACSNGAFCDVSHPCSEGACLGVPSVQRGPKLGLAVGGAPPSVWVAPMFQRGSQTKKAAYLERIPIGTNLTDSVSSSRPSIAWSGSRLWLVGEHGGALQYRIRDGGLWSGWHPLPSGPVVGSQGATVASDGTRVVVLGRGSNGDILMTSLTSALDCAAGTMCTWSTPWEALPATVTSDAEPAVAFDGSIGPPARLYVSARKPADGKLYYTFKDTGTWSGWTLVASSIVTDAFRGPSLTTHPGVTYPGGVWVAALEKTTGLVKAKRLSDASWLSAGSGGAVTWGTAPAVVSDGTRLRVFGVSSTFPNRVYQTIFDEVPGDQWSWGQWRALTGSGGATRQPSAAAVNGTVNLVTNWWTIYGGASPQEVAVE